MQEELDELNRLFTSKNVDDVIKFYDHFDTAEQLIQWMKNRPSAPMKIYEVEGDKDIIIVIPTADHNGKFAKSCADEIFKGQKIIFVESSGKFFNFARSVNDGVKYALKYKPRWIILSNDDMYKIDNFKFLKNRLATVDYSVKFCSISELPEHCHCSELSIVEPKFYRDLIFKYTLGEYEKQYLKLRRKFSVNYLTFRPSTEKHPILYKKRFSFLHLADFAVLRYDFVSKLFRQRDYIFNPYFINGEEDVYLSYELRNIKRAYIPFKIGSIMNGSLGTSKQHKTRSFLNLVYLNELLKIGFNNP